jgi:hypothetical protein
MDIATRLTHALVAHPAIESVKLVGSRARGEPTPFSDWDFEIATDRFRQVAGELPSLVRPLQPIAQQWDRLSEHETYMLILEGPAKVDLLFDAPHGNEGPWIVEEETLSAIDDHFWDWMLWLLSKEAAGRAELMASELEKLFVHLLGPMGVRDRPAGLDDALEAYVDARAAQERIHSLHVSRSLQQEVGRALKRRRAIR